MASKLSPKVYVLSFFYFAFGLALPHATSAEVSERIHKRCLDAKDYSGCVKTMQQSNQSTSQEMIGIGIQISLNLDTADLFVHSVIEGSPASKGDVHSGDVITKINGQSTKGMGLKEAAKLIKGKKGTKVRLSLKRVGKNGKNKTINISLTREKFSIQKQNFFNQNRIREWLNNLQNDSWDFMPKGNDQQSIPNHSSGGIEI